MQHFLFRDNSLDLTNYSEYELSIQTGLDGFSFIIRNLRSGKIYLFYGYPFSSSSNHLMIRKIKEVLAENDFLSQPFSKTTLIFGDPCFALIPETLLSGKLADHLLSTGQKYQEGNEIVMVPVNRMDAFLAFSAGKEMFDFLTSRFPGASVSHEMVILIRNIFVANNPVIHFHLHSSWFYALGFTDGRIELLNSYDYHHENDLVYFMLSVLEQPELQGLPVILSGRINPDDPLIKTVRNYIPGAAMAVAKEDFSLIPAEIPFHYLPGIIPT